MTATLQRRLGLVDAVTVGAGSMIGAGVFSAWGPAAGAAGTGLLVGLVVAAAVAFCNATSSAQLAARYPESGGTYVSGHRQLGAFWGHLAGWGFVVGKTASCVAIALTAGAYLWPEQARLVGVTAVGAVALVNIGGLTRTVLVTKVLLTVAVAALAVVIVAGWSGPTASLARLAPIDASPAGVLRAAGFLFFAFAGYARIATLGEEVRDPATTIPRAIPRALAGVLVVYAAVGITVLADQVITLCDRVREVCPAFPSHPELVHWSIPDPALTGPTDRASYPAFERTARELETRIGFQLPLLTNPASARRPTHATR